MGHAGEILEDTEGVLLEFLLYCSPSNRDDQIPHAFQQRLSDEKTPTLCNAIPAYEALARQWEKHQVQHPETREIVQKGLDKLNEYNNRMKMVPEYVLALSMSFVD